MAVTDRFAVIVGSEQAPAPEQSPVQPVNDPPVVWLRVTVVFASNIAEHVPAEHEMPAGDEVTVPVPTTVTSTVNCASVNVATTDSVLFTVRMQTSPIVESHPANDTLLFAPGVAVITSTVPSSYLVQFAPQLVPPLGITVSVPCAAPVPASVIVTLRCSFAKFAFAVSAWLIVTVHIAFVVAEAHAPPQPTNVLPAIAVAVSVTMEPASKSAEACVQAAPTQLMPDGLELTEPTPPPVFTTVSGNLPVPQSAVQFNGVSKPRSHWLSPQ